MRSVVVTSLVAMLCLGSTWGKPIYAEQVESVEQTESLTLYRKTSKTPGEELNRFGNFGYFHSNEPLGLEVMTETEVEILITGENVEGAGALRLHDVDNLHHLQNIKVGEKTTVTIPRKGQLFLDVANIKLQSDDLYEDFSFNVQVTLKSGDYEVTPTLDVREQPMSSKHDLSEVDFLEAALHDDNQEDGALMISENVRLYIPKSKYMPKDTSPNEVLKLHEQTMSVYNEASGLDPLAENELDRPRENFMLVSARNQQVGFMSAGNDMLDTHTKNIRAYLGDYFDGHWGQNHEYGHKYESGWGYQEYWCNVFANLLEREINQDPSYNWLYGSKGEAGYMKDTAKASYESYLKTGEIKALHPLYYFMNFLDNYDEDYVKQMSRQATEIPYGGVDYVAYFAAKNYGINIIPYLALAGDVVTNEEVISYIINETTSSYLFVPDYEFMNEFNQISLPPTMNKIYTGENRTIVGMSNPNATISIQFDNETYETQTDEFGKFAFVLPKTVKLDSELKVASTEPNKSQSFYQDVKIEDAKALVSFKGYQNKEFLSLTLNPETKQLLATSSGEVANKFVGGQYIQIHHFNKQGEKQHTFGLSGGQTADELAKQLNEVTYIEGDYLQFKHTEQYGRLSLNGEILNAPFNLSSGVRDLDLEKSYFYILNDNLVYSDSMLELDANKDDLKVLVALVSELKEADYTPTSWQQLQAALVHANQVLVDENVTTEVVSAAYELLYQAKADLREVNVVELKGYDNKSFLTLEFDTSNQQFIAKSNGEQVHPFHGSRVYASITHHDKKGNVKETYSIRANETADEVAVALNGTGYASGDYLKFSHIEQNSRLIFNGFVIDAPYDLSTGSANLNLKESYFYLIDESLQYASTQLDLSADKTDLIEEIAKAKAIDTTLYTSTTGQNLLAVITQAEELVSTSNVDASEITTQINQLQSAIEALRELNVIEFKGYNNETFLTLEFDTSAKQFVATSNGKMVHPYQYSREYVSVTHHNQKGDVLGKYSVRANETADEMAAALNEVTYSEGDYVTLTHLEQNSRLVINGYVDNAPYDLSQGAYDLALDESYFYLEGESLTYSNTQLDMSADKTALIEKIAEVKLVDSSLYTKTSYEALQEAIKQAESLVNESNVYESEIADEVKHLQDTVNALRALSVIEFKGMNNNISLTLEFDTTEKVFKATSNGEIVHPYMGANYFTLTHYDQKGGVKGTYSANGKETADALAESLDGVSYVEGDYLKLEHREPASRLVVKGYLEDAPFDLSEGVKELDLSASYFYLSGESLNYANEALDLSADKTALVEKINEVKLFDATLYTTDSYAVLTEAIKEAESLVAQTNVYASEITLEIEKLAKCVEALRELNVIEFKGYNNETFLTFAFDATTQTFEAISKGKMVHPYLYSREYVSIEHYNQKGELLGDYSVRANETADEMAATLNDVTYNEGDYLMFEHYEKNNRFVINGYVEHAPYDLSEGGYDLNLAQSLFYIDGESLSYSDTVLDLSADKTALIEKIKEAKALEVTHYTATSYEQLLKVIEEVEVLVETPNVYESELTEAISKLEQAVEALRELSVIEFKGMNNNISLTLEFDTTNKVFKATSNGETIHPYMGANYFKLTHYNQKGEIKKAYSASGTSTADEMAAALNGVAYAKGDYLVLEHREAANRLVVKGHLQNEPFDLSSGVQDLDLATSYFYLNGENLSYENTPLDLSADKAALITKINEAKALDATSYTASTYANLVEAIQTAEALVSQSNVYESEITAEIEQLQAAIDSLHEVNVIAFKGYNNETFLTLEFDTSTKQFVATSNGKMVHPYQYSREYASVTHYNQKGEVLGTYTVKADATADEMAAALNAITYADGDYFKLAHLEPNGRLVINGHVENAPYDLSEGAYDLNLAESYFYLGGESLSYSNTQLDLSADKTALVEKINEAKQLDLTQYTNTTATALSEAIVQAETLVASSNVYASEIADEVNNLQRYISELRVLNMIEFKGYNNEVFLTLAFDSQTQTLKAVSTGKVANPYLYSRVYAQINHYDESGALKESYEVRANETADAVAAALNDASFVAGDYLMFNHLEKDHRFVVKGYVENAPYDLSGGAYDLDLAQSAFYLGDESFRFGLVAPVEVIEEVIELETPEEVVEEESVEQPADLEASSNEEVEIEQSINQEDLSHEEVQTEQPVISEDKTESDEQVQVLEEAVEPEENLTQQEQSTGEVVQPKVEITEKQTQEEVPSE